SGPLRSASFGCLTLQASQHFHCFRIYRETLSRVFRAPLHPCTCDMGSFAQVRGETRSRAHVLVLVFQRYPRGVLASCNTCLWCRDPGWLGLLKSWESGTAAVSFPV
ncbi:hypothetical protein ABLN72_08995, partial [Mycobacterium tuberculosis]